jgi:hypothetical protein
MKTLVDSQLYEVARHQKRILRLLLISIAVVIVVFCIPATDISSALIVAASGLIGIISTVSIYRLAKALEVAWPWLYVVCAFIPYANTVTLLVINFRATAALKLRGIRVGLMGADTRDVENLKLAAQPGAAPNGGPATLAAHSAASERPPSAS